MLPMIVGRVAKLGASVMKLIIPMICMMWLTLLMVVVVVVSVPTVYRWVYLCVMLGLILVLMTFAVTSLLLCTGSRLDAQMQWFAMIVGMHVVRGGMILGRLTFRVVRCLSVDTLVYWLS